MAMPMPMRKGLAFLLHKQCAQRDLMRGAEARAREECVQCWACTTTTSCFCLILSTATSI